MAPASGLTAVTTGFAFETVSVVVLLAVAPLLSVASSFAVNVPLSVQVMVVSTAVSLRTSTSRLG